MCIECSLMVSRGDASPRMWICQDTKKPTTRFVETIKTIDYGIKKYNLDIDSAYQEAYDFLKHQIKNHGIYFCEDYFSKDLKEYWDNKYQKQNENKIEKERSDLELLEIVLENLQNGYFDKNHCSGLCYLISSLHLDRKISMTEAESLLDLITKYRNEFAMNKKGLYFFLPHNKSYRIEFIQKIITTIIIDNKEEKITTENKKSFFKLLKEKIMKKLLH